VTPAESIAEVLEAVAERTAFWKGELRRVAHISEQHFENAEILAKEVASLNEERDQLRRQITQAKHQRDMARLALTDIHAKLAQGKIGESASGEAVKDCLRHAHRGLTLSAQDDQPEAGQ